MATRQIVTKYDWRIPRLNRRINRIYPSGSTYSNAFYLNGKPEAKFYLKIQRTGHDELSIYLVCDKFGGSQEMKLHIKSWLENQKHASEKTTDGDFVLNETEKAGLIEVHSISYLKEFATKNMLFICCEITHEKPIYGSDPCCALGKQIDTRYSAGPFDFTIHVEGKEFKVSKSSLMSCSTVFQRMLSCPNSTEAQTDILKIKNMSAKTIEAMIHWIYQAKIKKLDKISEDLYRAAEKYAIVPLKEKCVMVMKKKLLPKNLPARLILAYKYGEESLKKHIVDYIRKDYKNVQDLMLSKDWIEFACKDTQLSKKIVAEIS